MQDPESGDGGCAEITEFIRLNKLKAEKTEHNRKGKKQNGGGCYFQRIGCRIFKTDDNSQHNDTNDIVDDGCI